MFRKIQFPEKYIFAAQFCWPEKDQDRWGSVLARRISQEWNRKAPFLRGWRGRVRGINRGSDNGILNGGRIDTAAKCRTVGVNRSTSRRCQWGRGVSRGWQPPTCSYKHLYNTVYRESIRSISCPYTLKRYIFDRIASRRVKSVKFSDRVKFIKEGIIEKFKFYLSNNSSFAILWLINYVFLPYIPQNVESSIVIEPIVIIFSFKFI